MKNQAKIGYFTPQTVEEAVKILARFESKVKVLAGGTDLLVHYYERLYEVDNWLDLTKINKLAKVEEYDDRIEIGAGVRHVELEESKKLNNYFPILSQAASDVGSPQIRNRGTIGGNIVNASPAGDLLPPLLAYEAKFEVVSSEKETVVPAKDFFIGPRQTSLDSDQLLTKIIIPKPSENTYSSWRKIGAKKEVTISAISLALVVELASDNKTIKDLRTCLGSVAPTPIELEQIKERVVEKKFKGLDFNRLGEQVADIISPIDDVRGTKEYRKEVTKGIMVDALEEISQLK